MHGVLHLLSGLECRMLFCAVLVVGCGQSVELRVLSRFPWFGHQAGAWPGASLGWDWRQQSGGRERGSGTPFSGDSLQCVRPVAGRTPFRSSWCCLSVFTTWGHASPKLSGPSDP